MMRRLAPWVALGCLAAGTAFFLEWPLHSPLRALLGGQWPSRPRGPSGWTVEETPLPAGDAVFEAMRRELDRTMRRLKVGGLAGPYYAAYRVRDVEDASARASFGALVSERRDVSREVRPEVRVGEPGFDNAHFVSFEGWDYESTVLAAPLDDDVDALRASLWAATDEAYKKGLERLARKKAYRTTRKAEDQAADLSPAPRRRYFEREEATLAGAPDWASLARTASAAFRRHPDLREGEVKVSARAVKTRFLSSEGSASRESVVLVIIELTASAQRGAGPILTDTRALAFASLSEVPSAESLAAEAEALAGEMTALAGAPTLQSYVGPVLFEGQAAAEFFNQLLGDQVSFAKRVWTGDDDDAPHFRPGALTTRLGDFVLPRAFRVEDDPLAASAEGAALLGHYSVDDEGVPAAKMLLVEDGRLKDLPMGRGAVKERGSSNGHGRGLFSQPTYGRIGNLFVSSSGGLPKARLKDLLRRLCREQGLTHGMVVRRMQTGDLRSAEQLLAPPVLAYRVDAAGGGEEPVRGLEFSETTLRALRDIVSASIERTVYNLMQQGPTRRDNPSPVPASVIAPAILVRELTLKGNSTTTSYAGLPNPISEYEPRR